MTTLIVSYEGTKDAWFDREYYRTKHLPLVKHAWAPHGMQTISAFFPVDNDAAAGQDTGIVAVCLCGFTDDAALQTALASPDTPGVMNDLPNFTGLEAKQHVLRSFHPESESA